MLGCAGMGDFAQELSESNSLPVVDGVKAAVCLAESLIKLNLKTSRLGGYNHHSKRNTLVQWQILHQNSYKII